MKINLFNYGDKKMYILLQYVKCWTSVKAGECIKQISPVWKKVNFGILDIFLY